MIIDNEQTIAGKLPNLLTVLFADISDSTKLYEVYGDEIARRDVASCVTILTNVMSRYSGRLLKTIGDEIMCIFPNPTKLVLAASDMQMAIKKASEESQFSTGALHIKIGAHHGTGEEQETDIQGEASSIAQSIIKLAKADQILVSDDLFNDLPPELRVVSRYFDKLEVEGPGVAHDVIEITWEVSGLTIAAETRPEAQRVSHTCLVLNYGDSRIEIGEERSHAVLGRVEGNDLVVPTDLTSRQHAEINFSRGRFHLIDNSSNGTVVETDTGKSERLRRESHVLNGSGRICLGGTPKDNPTGVIEYKCE
jgi:adenylate cyclase